MKTRTPQEIWDTALGELELQVSKTNYRTWFQKTVGLSYSGNEFTIGVPNTFVAEYLTKNQRSLIEKTLIGLTSPSVTVSFHVNGRSHNGNGESPSLNIPAAMETGPNRLNPRYTFNNFVEGSGNRLARSAALSVASNPGGNYNPLFIYGGVGLGKTHLLHAVGHVALANHVKVICASAEQFTNEFVNALHEHTTALFRNKYRNVGMLLIDDIHFITGKEQTEENFFHTFNELHNDNRQIVITSDMPPKSMPSLEDRLRSRFEWGLVVDLQPPDYDTRLAILQVRNHERNYNVSQEVLELIAGKGGENIRALEGAFNRVVAYAGLFHTAPTVEMAAKALENLAAKDGPGGSITPSSIIAAVAAGFQLEESVITGPKRDKKSALARRMAMYLLRQETGLSTAQIGRELGDRDAAAVTNACKKIAVELNSTPFLRRILKQVRSNINIPAGSRRD